MAFHVACPITCRKICYCTFGTPLPLQTPLGQDAFWQDIQDLERLLAKPAFLASGGEETVEVLVPRLAKDLKAKKIKGTGSQSGWESGEESRFSLSKKASMRKKATMAAIALAEAAAMAEQAKKAAEAARVGRQLGDVRASDGSTGVPQVVCELCLFGEVIGSKKAERMIPCSNCERRYHRICLKRWAGKRDLFNWSSWVCGSCRICEVCRRTGEPNKLMFCKRCDEAYHSYCQQPPAKQVSKGPFLCPKHTICHGCGSRVPGSGVSSRWFMGYTNCDACGRLFIKGKYCPICLKVYRDSEATPMVCCDKCEHWIHCQCDGISDEKYQEFQLDNDLHYICAVCRGDCSRVRDMEEATDEIWRRRDEAERDLILQYQAAAGVPSTEENMRLCPSDDESDLVEDRFPKKLAKPLPLKGNYRDKKSSKKLESGKPKNEKLKKVPMSGGLINKLKITLPAGLTLEQRPSDSLVEREVPSPEKVQKKKKKKDDSVVKLTKYMIQARESKAASNMKRDEADQGALGVSFAEKDLSLAADGTSGTMFAKEGLHKNEGSTLKLVNKESKKPGTKLLLHVPVKQKGTQNKVKMRIGPPLATMPEDASKNIESDEMYSDEGSDEPNDHVRNNFQNKYPEQMGVAALRKMEGSHINQREVARHHRTKDVIQPSYDLCRSKPDKLYMKGSRVTTGHDGNEELDSNDASSGKQGASYFSMRKREMDMEASAATSQDEESSDIPRKKLRPNESFDTKESVPTVPFKLKLKKFEGANGVNLDTAESPPSNHGNGNGVRGQRSKRKKHHLLEMRRMPEEDQEVESQSSEDNHAKELHDSWVVQKHGRGTADGRVDEDFRLRHKSWNRGVGGLPSKLHSTTIFNGGKRKSSESGESMRMRSHSHKFSRH